MLIGLNVRLRSKVLIGLRGADTHIDWLLDRIPQEMRHQRNNNFIVYRNYHPNFVNFAVAEIFGKSRPKLVLHILVNKGRSLIYHFRSFNSGVFKLPPKYCHVIGSCRMAYRIPTKPEVPDQWSKMRTPIYLLYYIKWHKA